jgi:hypothetical protein
MIKGELGTLRADEMCPNELGLPKWVELESYMEESRNESNHFFC